LAYALLFIFQNTSGGENAALQRENNANQVSNVLPELLLSQWKGALGSGCENRKRRVFLHMLNEDLTASSFLTDKDEQKRPKRRDEATMGESKLHEAELRYRSIFEQSPYGIVIIDADGKFIEFNEAAHRDCGYTRDEFSTLSIADIDPFQTPKEIRASMREILKKGEAAFEVRHKTKEGAVRDVHVIIRVVNLSGKRVFQAIWQDITERKQVDEILNNYRVHLEDLVRERTTELAKVNEQLQKDIARRRLAEEEREGLISELQDAMGKIKTLRGLLPTCAWCRKVRDDDGYWKKVETYIEEHSDASFTHGICPECLKKNDPETYKEYLKQMDMEHRTERRRYERVKLKQPSNGNASLRIRGSKETLLNVAVANTSEEGACIKVGYPLKVNSVLIFSNGAKDKTAVVRWRKMVPEENIYRIGIKFIEH
jgi:PAS domain S-box-containing protein